MAHTLKAARHKPFSAPVLVLAFWQMRQVRGFLALIGVGMTASIILVYTLFLFSRVALSSGLRDTLAAQPQSAFITIYQEPGDLVLTPEQFNQINNDLARTIQTMMPQDVALQPETSVQIRPLTILLDQSSHTSGQKELHVQSYARQQVASHITLLQGRLPQQSNQELEIAITTAEADILNAQIGTTFSVRVADEEPLPVRVVGLFQVHTLADTFWRGHIFQATLNNSGLETIKVLSTHENVLSLSKATTSMQEADNKQKETNAYSYVQTQAEMFLYYPLQVGQLDVQRLDEMLHDLRTLSNDLSDTVTLYSSRDSQPIFQPNVITPVKVLEQYHERLQVAQLPAALLAILVVGLLLLFLGLMAEMLVERQVSTVALMRSRGASRRQIFLIFCVQCSFLALLALFLGPLLTIPTIHFLSSRVLPVGILNLLPVLPRQVVFELGWQIAVTVLCVLGTTLFSLWGATSIDVLTLRRESGRETRRPFWQRFYLDIVIAIIAICFLLVLLYLQNTYLLDPRLYVLLGTPLSLGSALCCLLAGMLLLLRCFPMLLRLGAKLAARGRGVITLLALTTLARSPRQTLRLSLLLLFSIAFTCFTLIFTASQFQHTEAVATYQVGADFSGRVAFDAPLASQSPEVKLAALQKLPGVHAATVGAHVSGYAFQRQTWSNAITLLAVDAPSFVQATYWDNPPSAERLVGLAERRESLSSRQGVQDLALPAIVDKFTWDTLHLRLGQRFQVNTNADSSSNPAGIMTLFVLARVDSIPSINDQTGTVADGELGIMVDYASYAALARRLLHPDTHIASESDHAPIADYVWVRSSSDPGLIMQLREIFRGGEFRLGHFQDRWAHLTLLRADPLYLNLIGALILGAVTPLVLALICNLLASGIAAFNRLTNLAVLRALGVTRRQVLGILAWEQIVIYGMALGLGLLFGVLLALITLPGLIMTQQLGEQDYVVNGANSMYYALQNVPPLRIVVPPVLGIFVLALAMLCALSLLMVVNMATRVALNRVLRLNSD